MLRAVQENILDGLATSGELWGWWRDPWVLRPFPVEGASCGDPAGLPGVTARLGKDPSSRHPEAGLCALVGSVSNFLVQKAPGSGMC